MAIVLVHGAWGGSWCWERVVPLLEARGLDVVALDLPSVGADAAYAGGLAEDAAAVRAVLDRSTGPHVLCGHSYGGMVITAAAAGRDDVARLVYLCAFMPDTGESLFELTGGKPAPWIQLLDDGTTLPDPVHSTTVGYADCDPETRAAAVARLRPQVPAPFTGVIEDAAWRRIPSTYVVCSLDESIPPALQRDVFAPRATEVLELEASHSPFFSQPNAVAALLA
jgi:pimeloyl-ACP methyl ester carboxylesterase